MTTRLDWEPIKESAAELRSYSWRAHVIGGWLIRSLVNTRTTTQNDYGRGRSGEEREVENITMVFIPDPHHVWDTSEKLFRDLK